MMSVRKFFIKAKKPKYNNKKVEIDQFKFDSKKEGEYYKKLKLAKESGDLFAFYVQVPFRLYGGVTYRLDFLEIWSNGEIRHVDVKGMKTQVFTIKKKQVEELYGIEIITV